MTSLIPGKQVFPEAVESIDSGFAIAPGTDRNGPETTGNAINPPASFEAMLYNVEYCVRDLVEAIGADRHTAKLELIEARAVILAHVAGLEAERDEARKQAQIWFSTHDLHRASNAALGQANTDLFKRAYVAERERDTALAELTRLRDEAKRAAEREGKLREALKPFAECQPYDICADDEEMYEELTAKGFRSARAALEQGDR